MLPSKVCPQCNAVVPIRLKVCRNRLKFALYNADRVNFKSRNYHVVAYNISILAEGLHFSALVSLVVFSMYAYVTIGFCLLYSRWLCYRDEANSTYVCKYTVRSSVLEVHMYVGTQ